ncbi:MAG: PilZ domain-containing protein [Clostridia bacterium]|nr:PilZ domain-containing protein [Clostridia bacterium]
MEQDRRRNKRLDLDATLIMSRIDDKSQKKVHVEILDLSKTGIGFKSSELLKMNEVYEAELTIWTKEVIHTFLNITRFDDSSEEHIYGATFVGMPESDSCKIAIYEMFNDAENSQK